MSRANLVAAWACWLAILTASADLYAATVALASAAGCALLLGYWLAPTAEEAPDERP